MTKEEHTKRIKAQISQLQQAALLTPTAALREALVGEVAEIRAMLDDALGLEEENGARDA